jgi:hypothetical protein
MKFPSRQFDEAVAALCDDRIDDETLAHLHLLLSNDSDAQDEYLWRVELHSELATSELGFEQALRSEPAPAAVKSLWPTVLAIAAGLVLVIGLWQTTQRPAAAATVAAVTTLHDATWMTPDSALKNGDAITGGQRIELRSGKVDVQFNSGARMQLTAPAIVVALTDNSAQLVLGDVHLVAETPESKGFVLTTPTSDFVDIGTEFTASVAPDGLSRLEVITGEVDVVMNGGAQTPRLRTGEALYVEPGERKVTTRIESGDGTAAFVFPTIDAPSRDDIADASIGRATIDVVKGYLRVRPGGSSSGPPSVLLDGVGQSRQDAPLESAFFEGGVTGQFLLDLGQVISIQRINCFSWHQHKRISEHRHRAQQRYTLYGFEGDEPPVVEDSPEAAGWTRIARVNSDRFFKVSHALDRPAQQATSINAADGDLGRYRYLLWDVKSPTFFGEFDVFAAQEDNE